MVDDCWNDDAQKYETTRLRWCSIKKKSRKYNERVPQHRSRYNKQLERTIPQSHKYAYTYRITTTTTTIPITGLYRPHKTFIIIITVEQRMRARKIK